jgi:Mg-chelatase subunit ChlD
MMLVVFAYFAWIWISPINFLFGTWMASPTAILPLIINTIVYVPLIAYTIRFWLRNMTRRSGGPAAGIDVVEPGHARPEAGDTWGRATRRYHTKDRPQATGSKSEIRDPPALDAGFFVKTPDLDAGEAIFDIEKLKSRAKVRSTVSSGGWINKRVSSRGSGTLKVSESHQHGRPYRWRRPHGPVGSIDIPATVMAALRRLGKFKKGSAVEITESDIREKVFAGRSQLTVILVIDVSLSMKGSMREVRELLEKIESETRGSRDRAGVIAFKESGAIEVQAPTSNWNKIYLALSKLKVSGLTPLAKGLMKALEAIKRERMRNPDVEPLVIVISDFAPNIPLTQTVGPGQAQYTPVKDLVKASRLLRKEGVRLAAINVDKEQSRWSKLLKRPYHDALELAATLRMNKDGRSDIIETILAVDSFRIQFSAFLIARVGGGKAFLAKEILKADSILGTLLAGAHTRARLKSDELEEANQYVFR